jgi:GNAT superfamily N-acetyltransferase
VDDSQSILSTDIEPKRKGISPVPPLPLNQPLARIFCPASWRGNKEHETMVKIITANKELHATQIRELFWEYLQWANAKVNAEFGVNFEIEAMLEADMQHLDKFMPTKGRLLLCYAEERLAGIACLKYLAPGIGEIKRMYVRPGNRKRGLGRALINQLWRRRPRSGMSVSA